MKTMLNLLACPLVGLILFAPHPTLAQDGPITAETVQEAPPETLEAPLKEVLEAEAIRVKDSQDETFLDIWVRKDVPVKSEPAGSKGAVLFPVLDVGQFVGVVKLHKEAYDFRDQAISPGVYTLRYGLQPINGDHLGVSTYRDYLMLLPADQEVDLELIEQETLDILSADAAMTNHPAVLLLVAPPSGSDATVGRDEAKDQWGVVLSIPLKVEGKEEAVPLKSQLVVVGRGPV